MTMKQLVSILWILFPFVICGQELTEANSIYQFSAVDINGNQFDFSCLEGKKILIVNTASKCMYSPQLRDLEELYQKYKEAGFIIIAFPSNDFFNREPRSNKEIDRHYHKKYKISFPIMSKISVKGDSIHPIYDFLTHQSLNGKFDADVKWNFHKYLIDNEGFIYRSIKPATKPYSKDIIEWLELP